MHCAAMCGGLQSVLQGPNVIRSQRQARTHVFFLNLGRVSTYTAAGLAVGYLGSGSLNLIQLPEFAQGLRIFTGLVLIFIGLQLIFVRTRPFAFLERVGAGLWRVASRHLPRQDKTSSYTSWLTGFIWGLLPCGLVYSVLLTTAFSEAPRHAAYTMLGFGIGTLPAMLMTGEFYAHLRDLVRSKAAGLIGGIFFIQGGVLVLMAPYLVSKDFLRAYPQLMNTFFCIV